MAQAATKTRNMTSGDLTQWSAGALASGIRGGEISSVDAVEAHIARIERVNGALNAVVVKRYDEARREAQEADRRRAAGEPLGPLHGVPVTIKECLDLEGTPTTFGISSRGGTLLKKDDAYVARLRASGAVIVGKTNAGQLLLMFESDNPLYGRTNNPWNVERSPGGSSGGEAAIIAACGSPLGLGTDLAGSCRMPATSCGIVGFKPTAGRTPDAGRLSVPIGQRAIVSQVGVLAREVSDVALGLRIIVGESGGEVPVPLGDPSSVSVRGLRVAFFTNDGDFPPAAAPARAVREAAEMLKAQGAIVSEWSPPDVPEAVKMVMGLFAADGAKALKRTLGGDPRDRRIKAIEQGASAPPALLPIIRAVMRAGGRRKLADLLEAYGHPQTDHYFQLVEAQLEYQQRFREALDTAEGGPFDVILSPACALPALRHGASEELVLIGGYTCLYNLLGYPAGVVPLTRVRKEEETVTSRSSDRMDRTAAETERDSAGLPVGVQIAARPWRDHVALTAMAAIEGMARDGKDYPVWPAG
jgi:fatty acid amide hydrolase